MTRSHPTFNTTKHIPHHNVTQHPRIPTTSLKATQPRLWLNSSFVISKFLVPRTCTTRAEHLVTYGPQQVFAESNHSWRDSFVCKSISKSTLHWHYP
eukprot:gene7062-7642_t